MPNWEETERSIKYRLRESSLFKEDSFRTIFISEGISLILGKLKKDTHTRVIAQSISFDKENFDMKEAKEWFGSHEEIMSNDTNYIQNILLSSKEISEDPRFPKKIRIFLTKVGTFEHSSYGKFSVTEKDIDEMFKNHGVDERKCILDYDHQSESDITTPDSAVAAGLIDSVEIEGEGDNKKLFGWVSLNKNAIEKIQNGEYLFISPVISRNGKKENGEKFGTYIRSAALTNHPFFAGQDLVKLSLKGDNMKIEETVQLNEKLENQNKDLILRLNESLAQIKTLESKNDNTSKALTDKDSMVLSLTERVSKLEKDLLLKEVEIYIEEKLSKGIISDSEKQDYIDIGIENLSRMKRMLDNRKVIQGLSFSEKGRDTISDKVDPDKFLNDKVMEEIQKGKTVSEAWSIVETTYPEQYSKAERAKTGAGSFKAIN